jgi:hypothetical protein
MPNIGNPGEDEPQGVHESEPDYHLLARPTLLRVEIVAGDTDADAGTVRRGVRALVTQRAPLPDCAIPFDDEVIANIDPRPAFPIRVHVHSANMLGGRVARAPAMVEHDQVRSSECAH